MLTCVLMDFMAYHCTTGLPFRWIRARIQDKMKEGRHSGKPTNNAAPCEDYGQNSPPFRWDDWEEATTFTANTDCTTSIEVVRPYAIEEPDDDDEQANQTRESTGSTPQWQRDLVDSMDDLECESDASGSSFGSDDQARGKKRKPASTGPQDPQSAHSPPPMEAFLQPDNAHPEEPNVSPKRQCRKAKANSRESPWKQSMPLSCRNPSLPMRRGHPGALLQRLDLQIQATIMLSIKLLCQMKWTWIELRRSITGIVEQHVYSLLLANGRQHANPNRQHVILRREAAMTSDGLHRQSQRSPIVRRFSSPRCH